MKNLTTLLKNSISILFLFFFSITSYGQSYEYTRVRQHEGLVMQRIHDTGDPGICVMNFHSDGGTDPEHPDYIYLRATPKTDSINPNNLILTDKGLLMISSQDDCASFKLPTAVDQNGDDATHDVKLYVNGRIAVNSGEATNIIVSDERFKKNIAPLKNSLEVIRESNFVEFQYNDLSGVPSKKKHYGILAQEMKKILPSTISTAKRKIRPTDKSSTEFLMFNPNDLIYSGLNAIKELDQENQMLRDKVAELERKAEKSELLEQRVAELEKILTKLIEKEDVEIKTTPIYTNGDASSSYLQQNTPNPLRYNTEITYSLPKNASSAHMEVRDLNGKLVTRFDLYNRDTGKVTFNAKQYGINSGTYLYSLIVNEEIIESKKMIFIE